MAELGKAALHHAAKLAAEGSSAPGIRDAAFEQEAEGSMRETMTTAVVSDLDASMPHVQLASDAAIPQASGLGFGTERGCQSPSFELGEQSLDWLHIDSAFENFDTLFGGVAAPSFFEDIGPVEDLNLAES